MAPANTGKRHCSKISPAAGSTESADARCLPCVDSLLETHIDGTHDFNFTDLAVLYSPGMRMMGYLGPADGAKALAETASCVRTFFDKELTGTSSGLPAAGTESGCTFQPLGQTAANF